MGIFTPHVRSTAFGASGLCCSCARKGRHARINDATSSWNVRFLLTFIWLLAGGILPPGPAGEPWSRAGKSSGLSPAFGPAGPFGFAQGRPPALLLPGTAGLLCGAQALFERLYFEI